MRKKIIGKTNKTYLHPIVFVVFVCIVLFFLFSFRLLSTKRHSKDQINITSAIAFDYIRTDDLRAIKLLSVHDLLATKDENGRDMLMFAAYSGNYRITKYLLKQNVIINRKDAKQNNALLYSINAGNEKVVKLLIKKGADVNQANVLGITPLIVSIEHGSIEIVTMLLDNGADVNQFDLSRSTALHYAVKNKNLPIATLLLDKYNADSNIINEKGHNVLMSAIMSKNIKLAIKLVNSTNLNHLNHNHENALYIAILYNLPSVVDAIVSKDPSLLNVPIHNVYPIDMASNTLIMNKILHAYSQQNSAALLAPSQTQKLQNVVINK